MIRRLLLLTAVAVAAWTLAGCTFNVDVPPIPEIPSFTPPPSNSGQSGSSTSPSQNQAPARSTAQPASLGGSSWRDYASGALNQVLSAQNGLLFYAYDAVAYPGQEVNLAATVFSVQQLQMSGVPGVQLAFKAGDQVLGIATTDDKGQASVQFRPDKPGVYSFTVDPIDAPADVKDLALALEPAPLVVAAEPQDYPFVVIDMDGTIVGSSFARVLLGGAQAVPGSQPAIQQIAQKYGIIYLTARPDMLTRNSKTWLAQNSYPLGPLMLSSGTAFLQSGTFKAAKLDSIRKAFPNTSVGIGDKPSDAQAYVTNGMAAYLMPKYDHNDPGDISKLANQIASIAGPGTLQVVDNWDQIQAGILNGAKFPATPYVDQLRSRASQLRASQQP